MPITVKQPFEATVNIQGRSRPHLHAAHSARALPAVCVREASLMTKQEGPRSCLPGAHLLLNYCTCLKHVHQILGSCRWSVSAKLSAWHVSTAHQQQGQGLLGASSCMAKFNAHVLKAYFQHSLVHHVIPACLYRSCKRMLNQWTFCRHCRGRQILSAAMTWQRPFTWAVRAWQQDFPSWQ